MGIEIGIIYFAILIGIVAVLSIASKKGLGSIKLMEWDARTFPDMSHLNSFLITGMTATIPLAVIWPISIPVSLVVIWDLSRRVRIYG